MIAILEEDWGVSGEYFPPHNEDDQSTERKERDERSWWDKLWNNWG